MMKNKKATLMTVSALALAIALNSTAWRNDDAIRAASNGSASETVNERAAAAASADAASDKA